jgi:hypothetical protein
MDWSRIARETIGEVHASLPADATIEQRKKALFEAYPFGERAYWPYKAWNKAKRDYLRRFEPKPPQQPMDWGKVKSPLDRARQRAR